MHLSCVSQPQKFPRVKLFSLEENLFCVSNLKLCFCQWLEEVGKERPRIVSANIHVLSYSF